MSSRLIEQLQGQGDLFRGDKLVCRINYDIRVYQELKPTRPGQPAVEGLEIIEGTIDSDTDFFDLVGIELTLHIEDGRLLNFIMADIGGRIENCGNGLYRP